MNAVVKKGIHHQFKNVLAKWEAKGDTVCESKKLKTKNILEVREFKSDLIHTLHLLTISVYCLKNFFTKKRGEGEEDFCLMLDFKVVVRMMVRKK